MTVEQYIIDEIMDCFDFEKVHKVMTFLDWKWDGREVPEIPELKKTARDLLNEVIKRENQHVTIGTGGFQIEKDGGIYRLSFIVTDWECDIDDFNTEEEEQCAENE